jgi:hypothetical protein
MYTKFWLGSLKRKYNLAKARNILGDTVQNIFEDVSESNSDD